MSTTDVDAPIDPAWAAESNVPRIISVTTVFHVLALTSVGLRLYVRLGMVKAAGRDDWTMVASAICALVGWVIFVIQAFHGLGRHRDTIDPLDYIELQKVGFWQSVISATCAMALLKISIALNLLRLSQSKWYFWSLWTSIGMRLLGESRHTVSLSPVRDYGGISDLLIVRRFRLGIQLHGGHDLLPPLPAHGRALGHSHRREMLLAGAVRAVLAHQYMFVSSPDKERLLNFLAFNIFTDVLFATFPVPIIWTLQMKLRTRLYLIGILSLGYLCRRRAVIMGILKAVFQIAYSKDVDKTFNQWIQFWGFLQLNLGMIAACAPSLKPLVSKALKLSSYYNSTPYGNRSYGANSRRLTGGRTPANVSNFSRNNDFELGDRRFEGEPSGADTGVTTTFYKNRSEDGGTRSGSEEMILGDNPFKAGIVRTTEVTVQR
ncbi:hypothetical protein AK830_g11994 [Neonectria ditissima]|uniref:Rhodopsin domain-containing protein n=1 Tax=Neonectria ditissima TaxID=78410 RepID=A0A0P7B6G0_9HYPO|nr:hypothetical protein AK830_g11994 [Neonectria ditissima]